MLCAASSLMFSGELKIIPGHPPSRRRAAALLPASGHMVAGRDGVEQGPGGWGRTPKLLYTAFTTSVL
jgi:hypothetical protein